MILTLLSGSAAAATLQLNWQDQSMDESGFKIERLNGSTYTQIASVAADVKSYSDNTVNAGTNYCYRVRAFNQTGDSAPSNAVCITTPSAPAPTAPTTPIPTPSAPTAPTPAPTTPVTPSAGNSWKDYLASMKLRSDDNDGIGVLFRYQDENNYYRLSWFAEGKIRRLEKRVNGSLHLLAKDNVPYVVGRSYQLQISVKGSAIKVAVDGKTVFSVNDSSLAHGTIALYSFYNRGSYFDDVLVQDLTTGATLLSDDFDDGDSIGWTTIDEGNDAGPSKWSVLNGALAQTSDIGSSVANGKLGTVALYTRGSWLDYRMTVKLRSSDDDFIGVMFRVQDDQNYYRLSWERGTAGRRLHKREKGVFKLLAEDAVGYNIQQTYAVEIIAEGSALKINIDGKPVFSITDATFRRGTVALYSAFNQNSYFEDVLVEDLATKQVLLADNFNDGNLTGWKAIDEAGTYGGPSAWSVANGTLMQSSNIGSDAYGRPGTFLLY